MQTVHIDRREVEHLISATYPEWKGQKVQVEATDSLLVHGLNWSGGSRNQYRACTLDGKATGSADIGNHAAPWRNPVEGKTTPIPSGHCVIQHIMFCGKDLGIRIYVNPVDMPRYLKSGSEELTEQEKVVLACIRSYISSYRREEARRHGVSAQQYETLVEGLKAKGLLTKVGGLSLAGKNAAASLPRL